MKFPMIKAALSFKSILPTKRLTVKAQIEPKENNICSKGDGFCKFEAFH